MPRYLDTEESTLETTPVIKSTASLLPLIILAGCAGITYSGPTRPLRYAGSSTVATLIRGVQSQFPSARIAIDTSGESGAAAHAIRTGTADLAGIANRVDMIGIRQAGIASALVGRDAIATIVHAALPLDDLSRRDLRRIFTGRVRNWREVDGPDTAITPFIVAANSATHTVFRDAVLAGAAYAGVTEVVPDRAIVERVASTPGAIGHISFSFLEQATGVRTISIDGETPSVTNFSYPISRPLYLLWRTGDTEVKKLVDWLLTRTGQALVMRHFVSSHAIGVEAVAAAATEVRGYLIVVTETRPVQDGGILYYPHLSYTILDRQGQVLRRVRNHRSKNDETPTKIGLAPGTYLIRPQTLGGSRPEFFVTIKTGTLTRIEVPAKRQGPE